MLNHVVLVGRLVNEPTVEELENGKKVCTIKLAVQRSYKNAEGEYETDFIPCVLFESVAVNTSEYCKKGDVLGIRGIMKSTEDKLEVVAEKVTFLTSKGYGERQ